MCGPKVDRREDWANNTEVPYLLTDIAMRCPEGLGERRNEVLPPVPNRTLVAPSPRLLRPLWRQVGSNRVAANEHVRLAADRPAAPLGGDHPLGPLDRPDYRRAGARRTGTTPASFGPMERPPLVTWADGRANSPALRTAGAQSPPWTGKAELEWRLAMCNRLLPFVCELPACVSGSFFCHNGKCVPESAHCNGINECGDLATSSTVRPHTPIPTAFDTSGGESGKIETPNFPSSYRSNLNCRWLTFDTFETEEHADLVTILDGGPAENSTLVIDTALSLTSSTNMLTVRFRSDAAVQARGFQATWRANTFSCGGALKAQLYTQTFSSPRPYPAGGECAWRIEATPGQLISLNIETFDIEKDKDFLIIYDGAQPLSPILAKLTGVVSNHLLISTQSHLYAVTTRSSYTHGALLSPGNMVLPYPNAQKCRYTIELPESKAAQPIALAVFEGDENGRALHEGAGFSEHQRPPKRLYAQQGKATIVFNSNALKNGLGWNLTFSTNCPTLKAPTNVFFSSQNTAFGTKVVVTCKPGHEFTNGNRAALRDDLRVGRQVDRRCDPRVSTYSFHFSSLSIAGRSRRSPNGFATAATNVTFGGVAKYECYDGFSLRAARRRRRCAAGTAGGPNRPNAKPSRVPPSRNSRTGSEHSVLATAMASGRSTSSNAMRATGRSGRPPSCAGRTASGRPNSRIAESSPASNIPKVKNGRIVVSGNGRLEFGDSARVECAAGYRLSGPEVVHCLANQTLSPVSECRDLDECVEELATCSAKSTECENLDGGYSCRCLNGFRPQLNCPSYVSLTPVKVETTSSHIANLTHLSYCADPTDTERQVTFTFAAPKVLERIRFEKLNGGMPTLLSIGYANDTRARFHSNENLTRIEMKNVDVAGSQVVVLREPIEVQMLQITIHEFKQNPCTKIELMGCQKSSCVDVNECETNNGFCDHNCHNQQGGYSCSCNEGFGLFAADGQGGMRARQGLSNLDTIRFNKTCVPTRCPPISPPENGRIVSPFPTVLEFRCRFGHQIRGPRFLKCMADGTWNGTVPTCTPAVCEGIQNNTSIGMFVNSNSAFVGYGDNVTFVCTQQNRPARASPLGSVRQCIYDPQPNGVDYFLSGQPADCPLVDCGPPPAIAGAFYEGEENNFKVGSAFGFNCRPPYSLLGKSSYDDRIVRCNVDGSWDLGDLRCEGPVCVDPGNPNEGRTYLDSVEEGATARFTCNRPGYRPFPSDTINCTLGTPCLLSEDPHKARLSSTGWCGSKDAFIFLSVDLQRIYTLTTFRLAGVAGSGYLKGHVTKLQLFYKVQFSQNYGFQTEAGNHNRMYQFQLNPPVRARYILLGVTEYEDNPCLRFDMFGCLAPLSSAHEIPSHLQVGWNASVPTCIDAEPPTFKNCPVNPIFAQIDEFGQLLPVNFEVPAAVDNSGSVAHIRVEPKDFKPPHPIHEALDVRYTAFDNAGNTAECVVQLRVPGHAAARNEVSQIHTPLHAHVNETERRVVFNESSINLVVHDASNITELRIRPAEATIRLHSHVEVEVSATDVHSNQNSCKFQVALMPEPCAEWSLRTDDEKLSKKCAKRAKGTACTLKCKAGYRLVNASADDLHRTAVHVQRARTRGIRRPNPPACVAVAQEPARYELQIAVDYAAAVVPSAECMKSYAESVAAHFDPIGQTLTQRCSSSVQVFVRLLDIIRANYTVQILPTVLQEVFYELRSKNLLMLPGGSFSGPACPPMNATTTGVTQGFSCAKGEILRMSEVKGELPECVPCARGTAFVNNSCVLCPAGSFQDKEGQLECRACPDGTFTNSEGSQSRSQCLAVCGNGMYSESGLIPCELCPRHTYAGAPIAGGFKQCEPCPENMFTANLGSTSQSQCKKPCREGHFSATGLEPCSPCPVNYFQSNLGQQRCIECPNNTITHETGRSLETECRTLDCTGVKCLNKGTCAVENHQVVCECRPGFIGKYCEEQAPLCNTKPCLNGGTCEAVGGTFRCVCPQNFTGARCQFGPDECIGVNCPNGGVCQDLPGLGTTKCVCRSGFTGVDCSEISDPCQANNPCHNGADCVPAPARPLQVQVPARLGGRELRPECW
ncbi:Sushi, von Willebrand factor type A, EGF and pentraxin domain-containing protein 1 [Aphelenchoides fujianensis]|nr:Sushi, von Willebrand factor type A, EGF and pentraxin domain-containing protein 1 [Aphelenchoides fujianensis]